MPVRGWVEVSQVYCKGCELCIHACPQNVLAIDMEHLTPKGYHPAYLIGEGCTGCAICAVVCPEAALTVYREVPSRSARPVKVQAGLTAGEEALDAA
jgi:2-oxoglutarate ferredoxin oxidoreductase subunit delta